MSYNIKKIDKDNKNKIEYANKIEKLELKILEILEQSGKSNQFFPSGKLDILNYMDNDIVLVAEDQEGEVIASIYLTKGQIPFSYNDLTKYFKKGDKFNDFVKQQYKTNEQYKKAMLDAYSLKLNAYKYAKSEIEKNEEIPINEQLLSQQNDEGYLNEKSKLRIDINSYMYEYISRLSSEEQILYDRFYWLTSEKISSELEKQIDECKIKDEDIIGYENLLRALEKEMLEEPKLSKNEYFNSNTSNTLEIDTYMTNPQIRQNGLARILAFKAIKAYMDEFFEGKNKEAFLCSTLHRQNLSSKYVSEFFGLTDNVYVERRPGINREVHIVRVTEKEYPMYIESIEDKIAVLYGYNPEGKYISKTIQLNILKEQLIYEQDELNRLLNDKTIVDEVDIDRKKKKIEKLKSEVNSLEKQIEVEEI